MINIFWPINIKTKHFGISYHNPIFSIIRITWLNYFKIFWWFCYANTKDIVFVFSFYLIFLNLFELSPTFICANNTGCLVNNLFGGNIFNPVPSFFLFREFHFTPSAIVYSGSNFISSSPSSGVIGGKLSLIKSRINFSVCLEYLWLSTFYKIFILSYIYI